MAWPAATSVFSANAPMPSAGESGVPSASVIFCVALCVAKQYHGRPRRHARHLPHTARQLRITKSPGATPSTSGPTDSTMPAASWPSRNGKSSLMRAFAVVQVGVAHAARLHLHAHLARPGIGHHDRLDLDRRALAACDHSSHMCMLPCRAFSAEAQHRSHGAVVGADVGQHLAAHDPSAGAHEDVVDLAVRPARRPRAPAHRALPARGGT